MLGWLTATEVPFSVESVQQMHPASRPPYFSTPGAPQSVAEAAGMSRVGGAAYPQPTVSQPYPLPTRHHPQQSAPHRHTHPHPHSHPHPAILHSPQQRLGGGASTHSSQALRHFAQQHHAGQQQQKQQSPQQQQQQGQQERVRKPEGVCELCGISAMFLCSTCRSVWYCSQRCQVTALSSPTLCRT